MTRNWSRTEVIGEYSITAGLAALFILAVAAVLLVTIEQRTVAQGRLEVGGGGVRLEAPKDGILLEIGSADRSYVGLGSVLARVGEEDDSILKNQHQHLLARRDVMRRLLVEDLNLPVGKDTPSIASRPSTELSALITHISALNALKLLEAEIAELEVSLPAEVLAPTDGFLVLKSLSRGRRIARQEYLGYLLPAGVSIRVGTAVPARDVGSVFLGQSVVVSLVGMNGDEPARVTGVVSGIEGVSRSFERGAHVSSTSEGVVSVEVLINVIDLSEKVDLGEYLGAQREVLVDFHGVSSSIIELAMRRFLM